MSRDREWDYWDPARFYNSHNKWKGRPAQRYEDDEEPDAWIRPIQALGFGRACESPIETKLGPQLVNKAPRGYGVETQYKWKGWRMDFAILNPEGCVVAFVECDGAEFHRTREQRNNDRQKDIAAQEAGIWMFRFAGSKIHHHAAECAQEVWSGIWR